MRGYLTEGERTARATVTLDNVRCIAQSPKAIRVAVPVPDDTHMYLWIPQSVIDDDSEVYAAGHTGKLVVFLWWASQQVWARAMGIES